MSYEMSDVEPASQPADQTHERDEPSVLRETLGLRLRDLRQQSGKSLREVAILADLSPQFISLVERGQSEIGLSRLIRLTDAYDANIADLLTDIQGPEVEFVRAADAFTAPRSSGEPTVTYLTSRSWQLQPFRIVIEPGAVLDSLAHAGDEFIHCIQGVIAMTVAGRDWDLRAGDTIFVPPYAQHCYRNLGKTRAIAIGAVTPPGRISANGERSETTFSVLTATDRVPTPDPRNGSAQ